MYQILLNANNANSVATKNKFFHIEKVKLLYNYH